MREINSKENIIKFIMLGMLNAYKNGFLEFNEMHISLFAPKGESFMRKNKFLEIADFIEIGMELEDIHRFFGKEKRDKKISDLELSIMQSIYIERPNYHEDIELLFEEIQAIVTNKPN